MSIKYLQPFLQVSFVWVLLGTFLSLLLSKGAQPEVALVWFLGFWALSIGNLFLLGKTVASLISLMSYSEKNEKTKKTLQFLLFAGMKFSCLGLFLLMLWHSKNAPKSAVFSGLGTLIVVPIGGGLLWSEKGKVQGA